MAGRTGLVVRELKTDHLPESQRIDKMLLQPSVVDVADVRGKRRNELDQCTLCVRLQTCFRGHGSIAAAVSASG